MSSMLVCRRVPRVPADTMLMRGSEALTVLTLRRLRLANSLLSRFRMSHAALTRTYLKYKITITITFTTVSLSRRFSSVTSLSVGLLTKSFQSACWQNQTGSKTGPGSELLKLLVCKAPFPGRPSCQFPFPNRSEQTVPSARAASEWKKWESFWCRAPALKPSSGLSRTASLTITSHDSSPFVGNVTDKVRIRARHTF